MRLILGLDASDRGTVKIGGRGYYDLPSPLREVGALLEAKAFHPGRSAKAHLAALAGMIGIGIAAGVQHEEPPRRRNQQHPGRRGARVGVVRGARWSPSPASWPAPRSSTVACRAPRLASPMSCGLIYANSLGATKPVPGFTLSPWAGLGIICAHAVVLLAVGGWLLVRRDA